MWDTFRREKRELATPMSSRWMQKWNDCLQRRVKRAAARADMEMNLLDEGSGQRKSCWRQLVLQLYHLI